MVELALGRMNVIEARLGGGRRSDSADV